MLFIGICGASGSGKTTLAEQLIKDLAVPVTVIHQDCYYLDHSEMTFEERCKLNYDEPKIFDHDLLYEDICALLEGKCVTRKSYDFTRHARADTQELRRCLREPAVGLRRDDERDLVFRRRD